MPIHSYELFSRKLIGPSNMRMDREATNHLHHCYVCRDLWYYWIYRMHELPCTIDAVYYTTNLRCMSVDIRGPKYPYIWRRYTSDDTAHRMIEGYKEWLRAYADMNALV
jgi:hypothetical protein